MINRYLLSLLLFFAGYTSLRAIDLPPGFEDALVLNNLREPAAIAFAPDGRLFFGERISGRLRVAKYDALTGAWTVEPNPFYTFEVPPERHRSGGLRGFAFDPDFTTNGYLYAFYTRNNPRHNRVVRLKADPANLDRALAGSESLLIELPYNNTTSSGSHNGGEVLFGADGKLYVSTGDGWNGGDNVQSLQTLTGKVLRLNADGSIPSDNPFYGRANGSYRAIYALGLRNPYTMALHPATGEIFVNEARGSNKASVYRLAAGANYGHDGFAGLGTETAPWTNVSSTGGKLITGGAWYPTTGYWPQEYRGSYFAALWGGNGSSTDGRIVRVASDGDEVKTVPFANDVFASPGRHKPVMTKIGPDGNLYYLLTDYETGDAEVHMIRYTGNAATATPQFSPSPAQFDDPIDVKITSADEGAVIYFTRDGSAPTVNSSVYSEPISLAETTVLRAISVAPDLAPSQVSGGEYIIGPVPNIPPIADAGPNLLTEVDREVTLNGSASNDPDGSPLEIVEEWRQLSGPPVALQDADETVANFTPTTIGSYTFELTIIDVAGAVDRDTCLVTVVENIADVLDGLVARWRMEEGAGDIVQDYSPSANNGTAVGPVWTAETPDASRFALDFDGENDRVDLGAIDLSGESVSFTFWFRADDFTTADARFISKTNGEQDEDHLWMLSTLNGSQLRMRLKTAGETTTLVSPPNTLKEERWTHVAATYDGADIRLYVDGVEVATTPKTGRIDSDPTMQAALGNQPLDVSGGSRPFDGLLDEVRIYDRALTSAEIEVIFGATALPVTYRFFQADAREKNVLLTWETSSETDNHGFYVERSVDSRRFTEIGFVPAAFRESMYRFVDWHPINGRNYYRLRQVDVDGSVTYSEIRSVDFLLANGGRVYPNPASAQINYAPAPRRPDAIPAYLLLYDRIGRLVKRAPSVTVLPIDGLPPGIYVLEVGLPEGTPQHYRVVIE